MSRLVWEVSRRSFRRASTYRLAAASGVFVNTVFGYLRAAILIYVARSAGGTVRGMTEGELATFAFVSQGFIMIVGAFDRHELGLRIRDGTIVVDMYRPVDLQLWWLADWLGRSGFQLLARGVPPVMLGAIVFDLRWPDPWWHWAAAGTAAVLACLVGFVMRFISGLAAFWLLDSRGIDQLVTLAISFFGGLLLPITLFPEWLEEVARTLPFAAMIQLPVEVYLGMHSGGAVLWVLVQQLLWVVALFGVARLVLAAATRRVVVQGG